MGVHFYGFGCKKCGYARIAASRKVTFESFLIKANQVHSNKYQYENKNWDGVDSTFLNIICPIHGKFNQIAMSHVAGRGCPNCGKLKRAASKRQNVDILHQRLIECHDGYYNYDLSNFKSVNKYIDIICPKHGKFQQTPNNHLAGKGCYECGIKKIGDSLRSDPIDAINKFK